MGIFKNMMSISKLHIDSAFHYCEDTGKIMIFRNNLEEFDEIPCKNCTIINKHVK